MVLMIYLAKIDSKTNCKNLNGVASCWRVIEEFDKEPNDAGIIRKLPTTHNDIQIW